MENEAWMIGIQKNSPPCDVSARGNHFSLGNCQACPIVNKYWTMDVAQWKALTDATLRLWVGAMLHKKKKKMLINYAIILSLV